MIGLFCFGILLLAVGCADSPVEPSGGVVGLRFPGFCYTAFRHDAFRQGAHSGALQELQQQTASRWVALCVFEYQSTPTSADIAPNTDGRNPLTGQPNPTTSTPEDIRAAVTDARSRGMKVLLKPHVDVYSGAWRGTIVPSPAWFQAYTAMMLRYARLAEELGIELLCIGTEYVTATQPQYAHFWRQLIDTLRRKLLWAADATSIPSVP